MVTLSMIAALLTIASSPPDHSAAAAKQALTLTGPGGTSTAALTASGVQFVYTVSATLAQAGVKPAVRIQEFIEVVNGALLKATEVK